MVTSNNISETNTPKRKIAIQIIMDTKEENIFFRDDYHFILLFLIIF